jgi:hypothetical protein
MSRLVSEAIQGFSLDQRQMPAVTLASIFVRLKERCAGSGLVLQRLRLKLRPIEWVSARILPGENIRGPLNWPHKRLVVSGV